MIERLTDHRRGRGAPLHAVECDCEKPAWGVPSRGMEQRVFDGFRQGDAHEGPEASRSDTPVSQSPRSSASPDLLHLNGGAPKE
jgi:hypothetical protein